MPSQIDIMVSLVVRNRWTTLSYDNYVGGWAVFSLDLFVLTQCLTKFFEKLCKDISLVLNQAIQEA